MHFQPWIVLAGAWIGNCGFWLFCFNRINATGLPRRHTKKIEKLFIVACFLIPLIIATLEWQSLSDWLLHSQLWWPPNSKLFAVYALAGALSLLFIGTRWLESRLWLIPPPHQLNVTSETFHVNQAIDQGTPANRLTRWLHALPGNEIGHVEVTCKELQLPRALKGIDGLRVGHVSDLHLTGQYHPEHHQFVLQQLVELKPDLIVISGDIIDYDHCLPWIEPLLGRLQAPLGTYFVLGNHDRRLKDLDQLLERLTALGFHDLGIQEAQVELPNGNQLHLLGNELPWLERRQPPPHAGTLASTEPFDGSNNKDPRDSTLRIAVSHTPDQIEWARRSQADVLLAGHTHGGQVRFPGIGPVVAPSRYGSRFASGVFFLHPTLMHVSRGIAGTHPLRWRCMPEVSLLTLRNPPTATDKQ